MGEEISYEELFDTVRRERAREQLQEIQENFYEQAKKHQEQLEQEIRQKDPLDPQTDNTRTQLTNSKKLLRELYDRREKKILLLALNKARTNSNLIDTSTITTNEQPLYKQLLETLKEHRENNNIQTPKPPTTIPDPREKTTKSSAQSTESRTQNTENKTQSTENNTTITITKQTPKFIGTNGQTHGPYNQGSTVELPNNIAQILIRKGRAEQT
ncbi:MAG: hypothetical protein ACMXYD_00350 [Candidatus Woesearchaeota archaeon]